MSSVAMSLYGIIPADAKWNAMQAAWVACNEADIPLPAELKEFFAEADPGEDGAAIDLENITSKWSDGDMQEGLEIKVSDIPKNVKTLRFVNSY